jgi:hypothetical protein
MVDALGTLSVDLVEILSAGWASKEPAALADDLEAADGCAVPWSIT